jgi:hypothetical protein
MRSDFTIFFHIKRHNAPKSGKMNKFLMDKFLKREKVNYIASMAEMKPQR